MKEKESERFKENVLNEKNKPQYNALHQLPVYADADLTLNQQILLFQLYF
jgi:hypothetical protein